MAELGSDFSAIDDIDANLTRVSGRTAYLQAVARRLTQPTGGIHYDPDNGYDTRRYLSSAFSPGQVETRAKIEEQANADERTHGSSATVTFNEATKDLSIRLDVEDADGSFALVIDPANLTAELLED